MARVSSYPVGGVPAIVYGIVGGAPRKLTIDGMALQAPGSVAITGGTVAGVAITGGSINGAPVGASSQSTGRFTSLRGDTVGAGEAAGAEALRVYRDSTSTTDDTALITARTASATTRKALTLLYSKSSPMSALNGPRLYFDAESSDLSRFVIADIHAATTSLGSNTLRINVYNGGAPVTYLADRLGNFAVPTSVYVGANQVIAARRTGWAAATGTATRTTFATGSVTLAQLAERVKALLDDLTTHGLIGA